MTALLMFHGVEFADLDRPDQEKFRATLPPPIAEGNLSEFPTIPEGKELLCMYSQGRRDRLLSVDAWEDVVSLQGSPTNSQFRWYLFNVNEFMFAA